MARKSARSRESRRLQELAGLLLLALGLACLLSLLSYHAQDASWFHQPLSGGEIRNWCGWMGATLAELLLQCFGTVAFFVPWLVALAGWVKLRRDKRPRSLGRGFLYAALTFFLCALLDLLYGQIAYGGEHGLPAGGYIGQRGAGWLVAVLNRPGAFLFSATALLSILILSTRLSLASGAELMWRSGGRIAGPLQSVLRKLRSARLPARRRGAQDDSPRSGASAGPPLMTQPTPRPASIELQSGGHETPTVASSLRSRPLVTTPVAEKKRKKDGTLRQPLLPLEPGQRGYTLPPIELLNEPEPQTIESEQELLERARSITQKLREFAVLGSVVAIHPGPVVTTFEFKPDSGIKYSRITSMTDDLSLALQAESVRIDRLPGRSTVGIEVPNRQQETIYPRELLASERFRDSHSKLTLALGKTISGEVLTAELDRMPHLMIAGATGSGKSVALNGMIVSMLYGATPEQVRFIMIDTKMIELGVYEDIPHLLIPVVTEPKQASVALKWAVREMEDRYRRLAATGVRNISQFNARLGEQPDLTMDDPKGGDPIPLAPLPYIVIVIDELADLMLVSSADVEESIMRLAQMARAVGIHLIVATQRPSVDVITGTIKANFPSRIAFRVSQRVDSRTIIDQQGAEHLLGRGDMLFLKNGSSRLVRVHGSMITEAELNRITTFLKKMAEPIYDESILHDPDDEPIGEGEGERDEMYLKAVRTVIQEGKCSITLLQRRLQLGYARAARIVDMMEHQGVVSMGEGSKPREVLVDAEFLEALETR